MGFVKSLNNAENHKKEILYASDSKRFYGKEIVEVKIDEEDYSKCSEYGWYISPKGYVYTMINNKTIMLHRFVMNIQNSSVTIDHDDGDKLNNKKSNLLPMSNTDNLLKSWHEQKQRQHIRKPVEMLDKNTKALIMCFESVKQAAQYLKENNLSNGFLQGAISNVYNGVRKSAGGYIWRWSL